jgi:PAS domain-containing protein
VNDKFCAISKYSRAELLGQDHRIINSGHHPKDSYANCGPRLGADGCGAGEIKNRGQRTGLSYWVDTTIVPFLDCLRESRANTSPSAQTSRNAKRMEERCATASNACRAILETAVEGIITMDDGGLVESINPSACRMFGYAQEEIRRSKRRASSCIHRIR